MAHLMDIQICEYLVSVKWLGILGLKEKNYLLGNVSTSGSLQDVGP